MIQMSYEVAPLPFKPHRLAGLSERLLVSRYENNYGGAAWTPGRSRAA